MKMWMQFNVLPSTLRRFDVIAVSSLSSLVSAEHININIDICSNQLK